jgi:hypothetical protein
MEAYQERLIDEHTTLTESTDKLAKFIASPDFDKVSAQDQSYLEAQLPVQRRLLEILSSRVAAMELKPAPTKAAPAYTAPAKAAPAKSSKDKDDDK